MALSIGAKRQETQKPEENFEERLAKKKLQDKSRIKSASSYAGRTKKHLEEEHYAKNAQI